MVMRMPVDDEFRVSTLERRFGKCIWVEWAVLRGEFGRNPRCDLAEVSEGDSMGKLKRPFEFRDTTKELRCPKSVGNKGQLALSKFSGQDRLPRQGQAGGDGRYRFRATLWRMSQADQCPALHQPRAESGSGALSPQRHQSKMRHACLQN